MTSTGPSDSIVEPRRETLYIVQLRLDGSKTAIPLAEILKWADRESVELPVFRYWTTTRDAVLCLEFKNSSDAEDFGKAFPEAMLGIKAVSKAEV